MALTDENGGIPATMLVAPTGAGGGYPYPVYQGGGNGGGNGWDNGWWIILLFILLASGNWGGQQNGFGGGQPIVVNDGNGGSVQRGFDQAAVMGGLNGIQSGINNLSTQLCGCCGDMQMALANGFAGVEQGANARQMANMNQNFALQNGIADLRYTVATENCADRAAVNDALRNVIESNTANTQRILDQLCADKIDAKNERIAELQNALNMANLQASQIAQTAQIRAGQVAEIDAMYQRMRDCPVPTMPVYGMTPIFTCPGNNGCGCGNNI